VIKPNRFDVVFALWRGPVIDYSWKAVAQEILMLDEQLSTAKKTAARFLRTSFHRTCLVLVRTQPLFVATPVVPLAVSLDFSDRFPMHSTRNEVRDRQVGLKYSHQFQSNQFPL
jgi:hypothetical protein